MSSYDAGVLVLLMTCGGEGRARERTGGRVEGERVEEEESRLRDRGEGEERRRIEGEISWEGGRERASERESGCV